MLNDNMVSIKLSAIKFDWLLLWSVASFGFTLTLVIRLKWIR